MLRRLRPVNNPRILYIPLVGGDGSRLCRAVLMPPRRSARLITAFWRAPDGVDPPDGRGQPPAEPVRSRFTSRGRFSLPSNVMAAGNTETMRPSPQAYSDECLTSRSAGPSIMAG
jgi:hypothetical protein